MVHSWLVLPLEDLKPHAFSHRGFHPLGLYCQGIGLVCKSLRRLSPRQLGQRRRILHLPRHIAHYPLPLYSVRSGENNDNRPGRAPRKRLPARLRAEHKYLYCRLLQPPNISQRFWCQRSHRQGFINPEVYLQSGIPQNGRLHLWRFLRFPPWICHLQCRNGYPSQRSLGLTLNIRSNHNNSGLESDWALQKVWSAGGDVVVGGISIWKRGHHRKFNIELAG